MTQVKPSPPLRTECHSNGSVRHGGGWPRVPPESGSWDPGSGTDQSVPSENGDLIVLRRVPPWPRRSYQMRLYMDQLHIKQSAPSRIHLSFCVQRTPCHWPDLRFAAGSLSFLQAPINDICLSLPVPANYKDFLARPTALGHQPESSHGAPGAPCRDLLPSQHFPAFKLPPVDDSTNWTRRQRTNQ